MGASASTTRRVRVRVEGTVQGVGFRPFVYRLAHEEALTGYVLNDARGVVIEAEGLAAAVERLLSRLSAEAPPLAIVDRVLSHELEPSGAEPAFEIHQSARGADVDAVIAPDTATCPDCLRELFDPGDRRHRYPFVNCTNCGPRLTIVDGVPYDRPLTTMAGFVMCADCEGEYRDPADRRFHAQPNACPVCGPQARLLTREGRAGWVGSVGAHDPVRAAARLLADGLIVAVKGLGGYHLAADASNEAAVATLRARKHREHKPFALMVADAATASGLVELSAGERELLESPARPIVLMTRQRAGGAGPRVAAAVAPGNAELGVMLAYTPLHHLLLADLAQIAGAPAVLVMTSGNVSDEPIAFEEADAFARLRTIADAFLVHDRPIRTRVDDSVARVTGGERQLLRRSRGYVPTPLPLPLPATRPLLAAGAELKSTFCLARGDRAWISHHIGDLEHFPALDSYRRGIAHFEALLELEPELIAHDMHPGYASTAYAHEHAGGRRLIAVQHHHAHLAACLAEHGVAAQARAVGAIYDGTGYGPDGTVWGGEILVGGLAGCERAGTIHGVRLPGGAAAIHEPWRSACAWLHAISGGAEVPVPARLRDHVDAAGWRAVASVARSRELSPLTTSMGRLFDAVAALCGVAPRASYEGHAAIELTAAAATASAPPRRYELPVSAEREGPTRWLADPRPLLAGIVADLDAGAEVGAVALGFHGAVAAATATLCTLAAGDAGVDTAVLSGGVFQNRRLLEDTAGRLRQAGMRVLTPRLVPPNDGGIAYGQAAVAAALEGRAALEAR